MNNASATISPLKNAQSQVIPNSMLGMIFLLCTEIMFFAGLISAYLVNRANAMVWPPPNQPRLPVEVTAVNTFFLICSSVTIFLFARSFKRKKSFSLLFITMLLGLVFLITQGTEWVKLLGYGLTTTSSLYGGFFYTIIGAHAVHVVAGLSILCYLYFSLRKSLLGNNSENKIFACSLYWYFVVGIWPVLYVLVYLM